MISFSVRFPFQVHIEQNNRAMRKEKKIKEKKNRTSNEMCLYEQVYRINHLINEHLTDFLSHSVIFAMKIFCCRETIRLNFRICRHTDTHSVAIFFSAHFFTFLAIACFYWNSFEKYEKIAKADYHWCDGISLFLPNSLECSHFFRFFFFVSEWKWQVNTSSK